MSERDSQQGAGAAPKTSAETSVGISVKASGETAAAMRKGSGSEYVDAAFARAETEDDDGYDPWSDRPARREPLFVEDPWR